MSKAFVVHVEGPHVPNSQDFQESEFVYQGSHSIRGSFDRHEVIVAAKEGGSISCASHLAEKGWKVRRILPSTSGETTGERGTELLAAWLMTHEHALRMDTRCVFNGGVVHVGQLFKGMAAVAVPLPDPTTHDPGISSAWLAWRAFNSACGLAPAGALAVALGYAGEGDTFVLATSMPQFGACADVEGCCRLFQTMGLPDDGQVWPPERPLDCWDGMFAVLDHSPCVPGTGDLLVVFKTPHDASEARAVMDAWGRPPEQLRKCGPLVPASMLASLPIRALSSSAARTLRQLMPPGVLSAQDLGDGRMGAGLHILSLLNPAVSTTTPRPGASGHPTFSQVRVCSVGRTLMEECASPHSCPGLPLGPEVAGFQRDCLWR